MRNHSIPHQSNQHYHIIGYKTRPEHDHNGSSGDGPNTIVKVSFHLHSSKISGNLSIKDQSLNETLMAQLWLNPKGTQSFWKLEVNQAPKVTWKYVKTIKV
jgi:hypothetical protein